MKEIVVLGSTGSIGTQTLEIIKNNPEKFRVVALSCKNNIKSIKEQIEKFNPRAVAVSTEEQRAKIAREYKNIEILVGDAGLEEIASIPETTLVNGLMGIKGMMPTYAAIRNGNSVALANKETLVAGGQIIMDLAREKKVDVLPVDSEHSAIFQCLRGENQRDVENVILTASGGPFRGKTIEELKNVDLGQALNHPKWTMGPKITVDSATLMNKGLEVIEARWFFDVSFDRIKVIVHPESIIHSMVEFHDGSCIAQLGNPDMKIPISYAMEYPNRLEIKGERLNLIKEKTLSFFEPDMETFRPLKMAFEAGKKGGAYPVVLNGANEALVDLFLKKKIKFLEIQENLQWALEKADYQTPTTVGEILEIDEDIKRKIYEKNSKDRP